MRISNLLSRRVFPGRLGLLLAALLLSSGCQSDDTAATETNSGATNWLRCAESSDCAGHPNAACSSAGYCLDADGERIAAGASTQMVEAMPEPAAPGDDDEPAPIVPGDDDGAAGAGSLGDDDQPAVGGSAGSASSAAGGSPALGGATAQGGMGGRGMAVVSPAPAGAGGAGGNPVALDGGTTAAGGAPPDAGCGPLGCEPPTGEACGDAVCAEGDVCCDHCLGSCVNALSGADCPDDNDPDRVCASLGCEAYAGCVTDDLGFPACGEGDMCVAVEACPEPLCAPSDGIAACAAFCAPGTLCNIVPPPQPPVLLQCGPALACETANNCPASAVCSEACADGTCGELACSEGFCGFSCAGAP